MFVLTKEINNFKHGFKLKFYSKTLSNHKNCWAQNLYDLLKKNPFPFSVKKKVSTCLISMIALALELFYFRGFNLFLNSRK